MTRSRVVVVLLADSSDHGVRWGTFIFAVAAASIVVALVILLGLRTVRLRNRPWSQWRRTAALAWTVIAGIAAALSIGVTYVGIMSWGGGDLLDYMLAINLILIAWFVWRVAQCRRARLSRGNG